MRETVWERDSLGEIERDFFLKVQTVWERDSLGDRQFGRETVWEKKSGRETVWEIDSL